ncbi:hypothetical protein [Paenibacillus sp. CF384]|uniref:hypothetical protein n=1 Tax=Paenibacillus sp. CF384 TaxID=1884382 RepID=UPI0011600615|nr:hypothetical protein [Paenibacillus sp. CF384]
MTARPYAAGIPGQVRVIYAPFLLAFSGVEVLGIEQDVTYRAFMFDPATGDEHDFGPTIVPDSDGKWSTGAFKIFQDWVLVLERI